MPSLLLPASTNGLRPGSLVLLLLLGGATALHAQSPDSSRTAQLRAAREAKATDTLSAPERSTLESVFLWGEKKKIPQRLSGAIKTSLRVLPGGVGPETSPAARLAYVPFYERPTMDLFLAAGGSPKGYWVLEGTGGYQTDPWFGFGYGRWRNRRDEFDVAAQNTDLLNEGFEIGDQIVYDVESGTAGGITGLRPTDALTIAVGGAYATYDPSPSPTTPIAEEGPSLPFAESTEYIGLTGHLIWDNRDSRYERGFGERYTPNTDALTDRPLNPHSGTLVGAEVERYLEETSTSGNYTKYTLEAQHYLSFWQDYHTIALRHRSVFTNPDNDAKVPFYQLPYLGGNHTLRGYTTYRFRDLHTLLYNVEYRWRIWLKADLLLFADAGKTFDNAREWGLTNLDSSVGGGLRITTEKFTLVRVEVARSPEDVRLIVSFSAAF